MQGVPTQLWTILHQLQPLGSARLFDHSIVAKTSLRTLKPNIFPHGTTLSLQNRKAACPPGLINRQPSDDSGSTESNLPQLIR